MVAVWAVSTTLDIVQAAETLTEALAETEESAETLVIELEARPMVRVIEKRVQKMPSDKFAEQSFVLDTSILLMINVIIAHNFLICIILLL